MHSDIILCDKLQCSLPTVLCKKQPALWFSLYPPASMHFTSMYCRKSYIIAHHIQRQCWKSCHSAYRCASLLLFIAHPSFKRSLSKWHVSGNNYQIKNNVSIQAYHTSHFANSHVKFLGDLLRTLQMIMTSSSGTELTLVFESYGFLNDIFPIPSILDTG